MAALTLYFNIATATNSNFGQILDDGASAPSTATSGTGWTVGTTAAGRYAGMTIGSERAAAVFSTTIYPDATDTPNNTNATAWRTESRLNGTMAAGAWDIAFRVIAVTAGNTQDGRITFRVFKNNLATYASGGTEITAAMQTCSTVTDLTAGTAQTSSLTTWDPGAVVFNSQYLFIVPGWEITGAAAGSTNDVLLRVGSAARIITPSFTPFTTAARRTAFSLGTRSGSRQASGD